MKCKQCGAEMNARIKTKDDLCEKVKTAEKHGTWVYWRYYKCLLCSWQCMMDEDKVFHQEMVQKIIDTEYPKATINL